LTTLGNWHIPGVGKHLAPRRRSPDAASAVRSEPQEQRQPPLEHYVITESYRL